jgi:hypothetical protein
MLAFLLFIKSDASWAGAFLMPVDTGQIIASTAFSGSNRAFDRNGHLIPVSSYEKFELTAYGEYGLTEWLTLVAQPSFDKVHVGGSPAASFTGLGNSEIGARAGLYISDPTVVSVQALLHAPTLAPSSRLPNQALTGNRDWAGDLRVLLGHGFVTLGMPAFYDVEAGYRVRGDGWPNEWRVDVTVGARPVPKLLLMMQSFNVVSSGPGRLWPRANWHKLYGSAVYDLTPTWSIQVGAFVTVAGLNAGRELGPFGGIWYRF